LTDITFLAVVAGLVVVIAIVLWKFGSLQKAMAEMTVDVKTASAPAQALGAVVASVNDTVANLGLGIKEISLQAEKIATLSQRYDETEKRTKDIHSILIGSYSKGKGGEEALEHVMGLLAASGWVKAKQPIGAGIVEYAIVFRDGKTLPIDSKVVSTKELSALSDEKLSPEERSRLRHEIKQQVRQKIPQVQKYIQQPSTVPLAVMALPDSVMEIVYDLIPEAAQRNVMLLGYSAVPQLITSFVRIYDLYAIEEDAAQLKDKISQVHLEISKLDDKFFQNKFQRPLGTLGSGVNTIRDALLGVRSALGFGAGTPDKESPEPATSEEEEGIAVSAQA
jgi:DNA anti-recombination protein RmuC